MTMPDNYFQRFDASKEYEEHLFIAGRGLQSAELNEIQKNSNNRLRGIADVLFNDGALVRDASILVNESTGVVQCQSGAVYVSGAVRGLAPATFTIPVVGTVSIGVRLVESVITSLTDPDLRDPAPLTRNYDEIGADRLKMHSQWGWSGDGVTSDFFPVYEVINGVVTPKEAPPNLDAVAQALSRYDRDSAGGTYVVSGMDVMQLADVAGDQVYSIAEGRARVYGYGVEFSTSLRVNYTATPDLLAIANEPHTSTTSSSQRVNLDRAPATAITEVSITEERTDTLTHGVYTGAQDPLPQTSVLSIIEVKQGGTTYVATSDYLLTAGKVDWTPTGYEPAPGSTYTVKYRYITDVTPASVDSSGFTVTGAVSGTLILVTYSQMLPRIDRLCLDMKGHPLWIKGVASAYNQQYPPVPADMLALASINQTWTSSRSVINDAVRVVSMPALASIDSRFDRVMQLIAQQRLESNIHTREGGTKKGIFVDPFLDDSQRDAGTAQTAAIVDGLLLLPVAVTIGQMSSDVSVQTSLLYSATISLSQPLKTGSMLINPYMAFTIPPSTVTLVPAIDRWTVVDTVWASAITKKITIGSGTLVTITTSSVNVMLSSKQTFIETLRPISVNYSAPGFGASEALSSLTFDGISLPTRGAVANGAGIISGSFTIPSGVPAGSKSVKLTGAGGSYGQAVFFGQGTLDSQTWQVQTTETWRWYDPLAQTFTLPASIQTCGVDLWFSAVPVTNAIIQIRETTAGFPNQNVVAQTVIAPGAITIGGTPTRIDFSSPALLLGGVEYALVVMCNDAIGALSIAELGKYDTTASRWITSQPYQIGVLLSSSNASTWTPHQDRDLAFRIYAAAFSPTTRAVSLGYVSVTGATDLLLLASSTAPSSATRTEYTLTLPDASVLTVAAGQPVSLPAAITGNVSVSANLTGNADFSPVLQPGSQLASGILASTGSYVSRAVPAGAAVTAKVIYEAIVPSGATVAAYYKGPDISDSWTAMTSIDTRNVDDGFVEFIHTTTGITELTLQIKLVLNGTPAARPRVRDLRVIIM